MCWPGLATFSFSRPDAPVVALPDPGADPTQIEDVYHRSVLPLALQAWGHEALHASAVLAPRGVIAFCATAETGKSTIARALANLGYAQWADDAVVFDEVAGAFEAVPLPFRPRLSAEAALALQAGAESPPRGRCGDKTAPLAAICMLSRGTPPVADAAARINRLSPAAALNAILANAHSFDPADAERKQLLYRRYLRLVGAVPCFAVSFAPGFERLPQLLDQLRREVICA